MSDDEVLQRALAHARAWRAGAPEHRSGRAPASRRCWRPSGDRCPSRAPTPSAVIDELALGAAPGLLNIQSGRFFGWVMGGTLPAALGADWLVSAWDQNAGLRDAMPAVAVLEEVAGAWMLELLGLPDARRTSAS